MLAHEHSRWTFFLKIALTFSLLLIIVASCKQEPVGPRLPGMTRIQPRSSWAEIYPDFIHCVRTLPDTAEVTWNGHPTGKVQAMPTEHLDTDFEDFSWWAADETHSQRVAENVGELMVVIRRDALDDQQKELLRTAVHEMSHRFVADSYEDGDFGHTHVIFDRCTAPTLRPAQYPNF